MLFTTAIKVAAARCTVLFVLGAGWATGVPGAFAEPPPATPAPVAAAQPPVKTDKAVPEAVALPDTPAGKVMAVIMASLNSKDAPIPADKFNAAFQEKVSPDQVKDLCAKVVDQHGSCSVARIDRNIPPDRLVVTVAGTKTGGRFQIVLGLDKDGKIETLFFRPPLEFNVEPYKDWSELDAAMTSLAAAPAKANFGAWELKPETDGAKKGSFKLEPVHLYHADMRLAIGSAFKVYVLGALGQAVVDGKIKWDDQLPIKTEYKSLPTGTFQAQPEGKAFAVSEYADNMISISDNTATDHLIHRLGRMNVEEYMASLHGKPEVNYPFLTTREMFALKLSPDTTLMGRWEASGEAGRRDMIVPDDPVEPKRKPGPHHTPGEVANTNPELKDAEKWTKPRHIEIIEWFASAEELARVMADLHRLELLPQNAPMVRTLRLNPGLPFDAKVWPQIAFKGGSEPGVLNLTWMLTRADGRVFVVTVGWNNPKEAIDESILLDIAPRAVGVLEKLP